MYPPFAAPLGLQYLRAAKLQAYCGGLERAIQHWEDALCILRISHGDGSPLVKEAAEQLNGAKLELRFGPGAPQSRDEHDRLQ